MLLRVNIRLSVYLIGFFKMLKIVFSHVELKNLDFGVSEFIKLVNAGEIRNPTDYRQVLRVKILGFIFKINLHVSEMQN